MNTSLLRPQSLIAGSVVISVSAGALIWTQSTTFDARNGVTASDVADTIALSQSALGAGAETAGISSTEGDEPSTQPSPVVSPQDSSDLVRMRDQLAALAATMSAWESARLEAVADNPDDPVASDAREPDDPEDAALRATTFFDDQFAASVEIGGFEPDVADSTYAALADAEIETMPLAIECTTALCRMDFAEGVEPKNDLFYALLADESDEVNAVTINRPDGTTVSYVARVGFALPESVDF